jgi:phospholipid/cholesterol/gamma-HCH transport system substrate-binding protein
MKEEIKAGAIIVASLVILSGFIVLIGGSRIFEKFDRYYINVMNTAGLETGSPVKLGGVRVGRILSIRPPQNPGEPVTVEIGIKQGTLLYQGTRALISQVGFVGDIYLLLTIDNTSKERINPGEVIPSSEKAQFDVLMSRMDELSQSVDSLIRDMDKLFSQQNIKGIEQLIGNTNEAIVSGAANLDSVATSLKLTSEKLDRVLNEIEGFVDDNRADVSQLIKKAREDIEKAGEMIKSIEATAKSVEKTSKTVDKAVAVQSGNLDSLISSMTSTTEDLQELLQEIKNKPWSIIYREKKGEQ